MHERVAEKALLVTRAVRGAGTLSPAGRNFYQGGYLMATGTKRQEQDDTEAGGAHAQAESPLAGGVHS